MNLRYWYGLSIFLFYPILLPKMSILIVIQKVRTYIQNEQESCE
jgi:hypothetical protein